MILVNYLSDIGEGKLGYVLDKVDRNVSCPGNVLDSVLALDLFLGNVIFVVYRSKDLVNGRSYRLCAPKKLIYAAFRKINGYDLIHNKTLCRELFDRSLHLSYVGSEIFCQEQKNVVGNGYTRLLGLLLKNSKSQLKIGGLNVCNYTPLKASTKSLLKS